MSYEQNQDYVFRPRTLPSDRDRGRNRDVVDVNLRKQVIRRPHQNFFQLIFQRNKYLWLFVHPKIDKVGLAQSQRSQKRQKQLQQLKAKCQKIYAKSGLTDPTQVPICTRYQQVQYWTKQYKCRVALDESAILFFPQIFNDPNILHIYAVIDKSVEALKKLRNNKNNYKVHMVDDNYKQILNLMQEDMEKMYIETQSTVVNKIRFPNFMKLRSKDKAELIAYRNNIYAMVNLHLNPSDMQLSKKRFIEQCQTSYTSTKDINAMDYYMKYPFGDTDILKFYTEDYFFYQCLNNTLRVAKTPQEFFVIGQPINKMFHAIKNIYRKQFSFQKAKNRSQMRVYRGVNLSESQIAYLSSCKGNYIQIHGFVSTSLDFNVAKKFAKQPKKIIEIQFQNIPEGFDPSIFENDYGFVNLVDYSRYNQAQILFNTLSIFKVQDSYKRQDCQIFKLKYGTIFNLLSCQDPQKTLNKQDLMAYYTYRQLMGEKHKLMDLGQLFLKSNQAQKSVEYYESKIIQAKGQKRSAQQLQLIINKSQALIQNGQPSKALQTMTMLLNDDKKKIVKTEFGTSFLQNVLNDKQEMIRSIDIRQKYSQAGASLDKFDDAEAQLEETSEAISNVLRKQDEWNFDIAFKDLEIGMQLVHLKQSIQNYQQMMKALIECEKKADAIIQKIDKKQVQISFYNQKQVLLEKTLIYSLMAKIRVQIESEQQISRQQLDKRYDEVQNKLKKLIQQKSYDESLIKVRKTQLQKLRSTFQKNKQKMIQDLTASLINIRLTSDKDENIPRTYDMLASIQKTSNSTKSTNSAINYYQKSFMSNTHNYGQNDPRCFQSMINIAQCNREIRDSQHSVDLLRQQIKVVPYRNKPKHTIISKTLYTMGLSYLDLGHFSYALKCFEKGLNMLKQILTKNQLQKYHHRFKLELQIGRTFTSLTHFQNAQTKLSLYHSFIIKLHKGQHSDIANSLNYYAILYLRWKKMEQAKKSFEQSYEMFKFTSGDKSVVVAKILCNLGIIYGISKQKNTGIDRIEQAKMLFNQLYLKNDEKSKYKVHSQSHMLQYYIAQINRCCQCWQEAINYYKQSLRCLQEYRDKLYQERKQLQIQNSYISQFTPMLSLLSANKKDNHELLCRIKIMQCKAKLKQFDFEKQLNAVTESLKSQHFRYVEAQNSRIQSPDEKVNSAQSQLNNLLKACEKLQKYFNNKKMKALSMGIQKNSKAFSKDVNSSLNPTNFQNRQKANKTLLNGQPENTGFQSSMFDNFKTDIKRT